MSASDVTALAAEAEGVPPGSAPGGWLDRMLEKASERLNPILVKETRQALKSQQFVLWFLLLLSAVWVVTVGGIAWIGPGVQYAACGGLMFMAYYVVLCVALIVVVPFAAFRSLAAEQEDNTRDVLMVSALTERQVINGKIGSAALQMIVYLSALAPCLAFTYLLRGIDLVTIVLLPTLAVLASIGLSMLALLLASAATQRYAQVLVSVGLVAGLLGSLALCLQAGAAAVDGGYRNYQDWEFWMLVGMGFTAYVCAVLLAYYGAAALNAFASANRSTALRKSLMFTQACFIGWVASIWMLLDYDASAIDVACLMAWLFWGVAGAFFSGEPPVLSERVRRTLPVSGVGRALGTWFNPGPGTGYVFVVANAFTLGLLAAVALMLSDRRSLSVEYSLVALVVGLAYLVAFLGVGRLIVIGLRKVAHLSMLGCFLVHFLLLLTCAGGPELLRASVQRYGRLAFSWYDLPSPFRGISSVLSEEVTNLELPQLLVVVVGGAACMLLVNLAMAAQEVRLTRSPLPQRVIEDDRELSPAEQSVTNPWGDVQQADPPGGVQPSP